MMPSKRIKKTAVVCILGCGLLTAATRADSVSYTFFNVTNNSSDISSQFKLTVSDDSVGAGQIGLLFENLTGGAASSIANIYFEEDALFSSFSSFTQSAGVNFDLEEGSPSDPPGIDGFSSSSAFSAQADSPKPTHGINPGEWLRIINNLQVGLGFGDVVAALNNGFLKTQGDPGFDDNEASLRVAFHVIGLADGESDSYLNGNSEDPVNIPLPTPFGLALAGLGGIALTPRRRRS